MIDIKTIGGEQLMSVPILQDAVIHEELMVSGYIALAWNSEEDGELPVGTFIEFEGERYSLYEPYTPTMVNEGEYRYNPRFYSREEAWNKQPACVYTYEDDGVTVKSREFDWSFVGSPADAMQIIKQAIKNEIGEDWAIVIADSLPSTIEISSQTSSIASILSDIVSQCETEYWVDRENNALHLSKCEHGESVILEVGSNVGVPAVSTKGNEYYTRYYALGSTRNITQTSGNISGSVNKRLTLDPAVFPMGYKDIKGHFEDGVFVSDLEQGEIFSKVVLFDDIYPSSDLEITDVRARMKYRLDGGKKVKIGGTDENPVYDQYAIWYFKIKDFTFSEDLLIEGLPLSVHFKSGRLTGQEFELIYHDKSKTENAEGDVIPFEVQAGDYEIKFKKSSGTILPDIGYIIPQNTDKVTLFNIEMPTEYTESAQQRLLEALDKVIAKEHEDNNTYEVESNPISFYESDTVVFLGQRVSFVNGGKSLDTRVLMVERRLDSPSEQKIRVGNDLIQGSTKELRENVASLNHNVDVLAAFNDLSKSVQDSYGRTQALINESIASVLGIWSLDADGNLVTDMPVIIKNNLVINGDTTSTTEGTDAGVSGTVIGIRVDDNTVLEPTNGIVDMSDVLANLEVDVDLSDYYTSQETDAQIASAVAGLNLSQYATKASLETLQGEVDNIEAVLGMDEEAGDIINTWNEVKAFLDGYSSSDDLASILSAMNADIAKRALDSDLDTLALEVGDNTTNIKNAKGEIDTLKTDKADKATTLAGYGITDAYTKDDLATYKAWWDDMMSLVVKEGSNIKIKTNLIVEGDTASTAQGTDSGTSGTLIGVVVNGTPYEDETNGMLDLSTLMNQYALATAIPSLDGYAKLTDIPTIPSSLKNPYALTFGDKTYDGSSEQTITAADLGALTEHQSIYGLTIKNSAGTQVLHYNPAASVNSLTLIKDMVGLGNVDNTADASKSVKYATSAGSAPASDVYAWAKKSSLAASDVPDLSSKYLSTAGGTIEGNLSIGIDNKTTDQYLLRMFRLYDSERHRLLAGILDSKDIELSYYNQTVGTYARLVMGTSGYKVGGHTLYDLLHSGNYSSYALPLSGGTISGPITFSSAAPAMILHRTSGTPYLRFGAATSSEYGEIGVNSNGDAVFWSLISSNSAYNAWNTLIHSGNIGSYKAGSATKLATARTIWGQSFDGTGNVQGDLSLYPTTQGDNQNSGRLRFHTLAGRNTSPYIQGISVSGGYTKQRIGFFQTNASSYTPEYFEAMSILPNGNVLIGTTTDSGYKLDVNGTARISGAVTMSSTLSVGGDITTSTRIYAPYLFLGKNAEGIYLSDNGISWHNTSNSYTSGLVTFASNSISLQKAVTMLSTLTVNGNAIFKSDTSTGSDIRFKDKLSDHRIALSDIANAPLFTFKWNDREDDSVHLGTSAQYWETVAPWLVKGEDFKTLDYASLGVAIGISVANKTLNHEERIKILEKENKALKEELRRIQYGS